VIPPINHIILIPLILGLGIFIGIQIGQRQIKEEWARAEKKRAREEG
jgi:uncharacterized protein YneF (UPF0154 family)